MKLQPESQEAVPEIMVEIIGPDGLKHHVGPFKSNAAARAWIARNAPDNSPLQDRGGKKFATDNRRDPATSD